MEAGMEILVRVTDKDQIKDQVQHMVYALEIMSHFSLPQSHASGEHITHSGPFFS